MDIKLQICEGCESVITIDASNIESVENKAIYDCPICGTFNELELKDVGELIMNSPNIEYKEKEGSSKVIITDLPEEVDSAIKVLVDNGWNIKFVLRDK